MQKPMCPVVMTPVVAFGVGLSLESDDPNRLPYASLPILRKTKVYLGDFRVEEFDIYGTELGQSMDVRIHGGLTICELNDAVDLVLMVSLRGTARSTRSVIRPMVQDGSPYPVKLRHVIAGDPTAPELPELRRDSFGNRCRRR
jgi:hypothetical protein